MFGIMVGNLKSTEKIDQPRSANKKRVISDSDSKMLGGQIQNQGQNTLYSQAHIINRMM